MKQTPHQPGQGADAGAPETHRRTPLRSGMAYSAMVDDIRGELDRGKLKLRDRLPGEVALAARYDISVTSVRRGIEVLVDEGLLERRRGSGTYVCGFPAPLGRRPTRRDSVALIWPTVLDTYHPFYTELFSALRTTLGQQGWAVWEPELREAAGGADIHMLKVTPKQVLELLSDHPELAGLITRGWLAPEPGAGKPESLAVVTSDLGGQYPAVGYRWMDEIERAFRELLSRGRRRLWCVTVFEDDRVCAAAARAAAALGVTAPELYLERTPRSSFSLSRTVHTAFELAKRDLGAPDGHFDGVFAGDDFLAQGVLDALRELGKSIPEDLHMATILNRESHLRDNCPLIELVADGAAVGRSLGQLMHQHIVNGKHAPKDIVHSCELHTHD